MEKVKYHNGCSAGISRRSFLFGCLAASTPLLTSCSPAEYLTNKHQSTEIRSIVLQIDGAAVPYYAPLYIAEYRGYFQQQNLQVTFTYAQGSAILQNVASGNVDFGFPNGDSVINAYGHGVQTKVVHTTYQKGIGALLFSKDSGINTPRDLIGKSVGITDLGSPNYAQLKAMLGQEGASIDDVNLQIIGPGAIVSALTQGSVDAIVFSRLRYFSLKEAGFPVELILSDDYLPSFGNVVVTSERNLVAHPEVVSGFVKALNLGIEDCIADPESSIEIAIEQYAPAFADQKESIIEIIRKLFVKELWQSSFTDAHQIGYGSVDRWQEAIDSQVKYDIIDHGFNAREMVVNPR